ncbi:hypothetical protein EXS65_05040 [Candidatus Peribacteria bacterium]|nr:hypothetical protein [Candidatus Peribacteria bacterium]
MNTLKNAPGENPKDKVPAGKEKSKVLQETVKELVSITDADARMKKLQERVRSRVGSKELKQEFENSKLSRSPELAKAMEEHEATLPEAEEGTTESEKPWYESYLMDPIKSFTDPILQRISKYTGIKGNDLKSIVYKGMSYATALAPAWLVNLIPALNYGRYKLEEMEVEEAITKAVKDNNLKGAEQKIPDLKIAFAGFDGEDHKELDRYMADNNQEKKATVRKLAQECINTKLKAGTSFAFTVDEMMMKQDDIAKEVAGTVASDRKTKLVNGWKDAGEIGEVKTSEIVTAERNGEKWDISLPEKMINEGAPTSPEAQKLSTAMKALTNGKKITVIGNDKATILDTEAKSIELSANDATPFNLLNDVLPRFNPRGSKLILATATTNNVQAILGAGSFTVYQNKDRNKGLEQIEGLYTAASGANANSMFTYKGGIWRLETAPVKLS